MALDELVNLYKLTSSRARNANYEQILRILNDVLQGTASHLGFMLGGTPEFLMDTRRGLYGYEALQSRLAQNTFARGRTRGFLGAGDPALQPDARGHVRPTRQHPTRHAGRRGVTTGCCADCVHGTLLRPYR